MAQHAKLPTGGELAKGGILHLYFLYLCQGSQMGKLCYTSLTEQHKGVNWRSQKGVNFEITRQAVLHQSY